jgi:glycosyltransferase involved in cell wall biosynthesis
VSKALQLTLSFEPGGRREAVLTLARGLAAAGLSADLACVEQLGCEPQVLDGVFGQSVPLQRDRVGTRQALARLVRLCDARHIDLIHTHDAASQWLAARLRLARPKIKLLMTFHRSLGFESAGWKAKLRNAAAGLATAAIVTGSRDRLAHYLSENYVRAGKVVRIPFGIDLARFRPNAEARAAVRAEMGVAEADLLIGAVGHFGPEKGIDLAVRSFVSLAKRQAPLRAKLVVVGRGTAEQEQTLRELAAPAGGAVCFAGFCRDVERYFAAMDVFLHVPRQEAFGLVVAEAMACGVPVVGAQVGGVPDMVRDGRTGITVAAEQPEEAAAALAQLGDDEALRQQLSAEALRVAHTEYSETLYVRRHVALYREILAARAPCGVDEAPAINETRTNDIARLPAPAAAQEVCDV